MGKEYFYTDPDDGKEKSIKLGGNETGKNLETVQELSRLGLITKSARYNETPPKKP